MGIRSRQASLLLKNDNASTLEGSLPRESPAMVAAPRLRIRLQFDEGSRLGPGKADLLESIGATGSISAAGREMKMSYTRAWALVDQMNESFAEPLVTSARGGAKGGGARLTAAGETVLAEFRALEAAAEAAGDAHIAAITALRKEAPDA